MLNETLKALRKAKGLSQEELAAQLHVVRQTISKWEQGLSVPDAAQLIRLAEVLDTSVAVLLDETPTETEPENSQVLAAKLTLLNEQFAREQERKRKNWRIVCLAVIALALVAVVRALLPWFYYLYVSSALRKNSSGTVIGGADGPTTIFVAGSMQYLLILVCAVVLIAACVGIWRTRRK